MYWNKLFFVTQSEKRGTLLLLLLVFVLLSVRILLAQQSAKTPHFTEQNNALVADTAIQQKPHVAKSIKTDLPVELNTADTTLLKQLRGIGSGYAKMIVNYRTKLGGFYSKEQLLEVYRFPAETYAKIEHQVWVDTTYIQKLPINQLSIDQLKRHPYIRYFQAKSLYDNRLNKPEQRYNALDDLVEDRDVTPQFIAKIAPYLSFK
jgi:DNA uptake protein ComE-like DNA-binding protein